MPGVVLRQKFLARRCAEWIDRDSVGCGRGQGGFLHGKMYLADGPDGEGAAVVGSSNFTKRGLGGGADRIWRSIWPLGSSESEELASWFDQLWNDDELTRDAKAQVLAALGRVGQEHAPEFVYFKTLYELFHDEINTRLADKDRFDNIHLYDTQVWKALFEFQQDGVHSVISALQRHNGCILADSVGLGKTYTALAVIKYFELRNQRVRVLCPRKLRDNWSLYAAAQLLFGQSLP